MLAVVLAGGENRRLPITKGFIKIGGRRLIEGLLAGLGGLFCFDRLAISTNEPGKYFYLGVPLVGDVYPVRGPMTGIFSALSCFPGEEGAFFIACDMPFFIAGLASRLAEIARRPHWDNWDVIAPVWKDRAEPLFAFYSARCLPAMEERLFAGKPALQEFLGGARTIRLNEDEVRGIDPEGHSFVNINTVSDLKAAVKMKRAKATRASASE